MKTFPKVGLDNILLGMNRSQARSVLGEPMSIEHDPDEEHWHYEQGIELTFQKDYLYLLGSITISSASAELDSMQIVGLSEEGLLRRFPFFSIDDDFEELGSKDYLSSEKELSVWLSDGVVSNITIFPEYEETGEIPIWPNGAVESSSDAGT